MSKRNKSDWDFVFIGANPLYGYLSTHLAQVGFQVLWIQKNNTHFGWGLLEQPFFSMGAEPPVWPLAWFQGRINGCAFKSKSTLKMYSISGVWVDAPSFYLGLTQDAISAGCTVKKNVEWVLTPESLVLEGETFDIELTWVMTDAQGEASPWEFQYIEKPRLTASGMLEIESHASSILSSFKTSESVSQILLKNPTHNWNDIPFGYCADLPINSLELFKELISFEGRQMALAMPHTLLDLRSWIWNSHLFLMVRYLGEWWLTHPHHDQSDLKPLAKAYEKQIFRVTQENYFKFSPYLAF